MNFEEMRLHLSTLANKEERKTAIDNENGSRIADFLADTLSRMDDGTYDFTTLVLSPETLLFKLEEKEDKYYLSETLRAVSIARALKDYPSDTVKNRCTVLQNKINKYVDFFGVEEKAIPRGMISELKTAFRDIQDALHISVMAMYQSVDSNGKPTTKQDSIHVTSKDIRVRIIDKARINKGKNGLQAGRLEIKGFSMNDVLSILEDSIRYQYAKTLDD